MKNKIKIVALANEKQKTEEEISSLEELGNFQPSIDRNSKG